MKRVIVCMLIIIGMSCKSNSDKSGSEIAINSSALEKMEDRIASEFIYDVGTRFSAIKKSEIDKATSLGDFFDENQLQKMVSIKATNVIFIINDSQSEIREAGKSNALNSAQLELLQSADYSTNFLIRADYQAVNKETGRLEDSYATPHLTIVPEVQAAYLPGKKSLIEFLEENSKAPRIEAKIEVEKLQPAKLFFTVTKQGNIDNVRLDRTSNYPSVDNAMIELVKSIPGIWKPAENVNGELVDQELVISFGLMGC